MSQRSGSFDLTFGTEAATVGANKPPTTLAITDTNPHFSDWIDASQMARLVLACVNTHNQVCTVTFQGSISKAANQIKNLPTTLSLGIGNVTPTFDAATLSDPWPFLRAQFQFSVAPAGGAAVSAKCAYREVVS